MSKKDLAEKHLKAAKEHARNMPKKTATMDYLTFQTILLKNTTRKRAPNKLPSLPNDQDIIEFKKDFKNCLEMSGLMTGNRISAEDYEDIKNMLKEGVGKENMAHAFMLNEELLQENYGNETRWEDWEKAILRIKGQLTMAKAMNETWKQHHRKNGEVSLIVFDVYETAMKFLPKSTLLEVEEDENDPDTDEEYVNLAQIMTPIFVMMLLNIHQPGQKLTREVNHFIDDALKEQDWDMVSLDNLTAFMIKVERVEAEEKPLYIKNHGISDKAMAKPSSGKMHRHDKFYCITCAGEKDCGEAKDKFFRNKQGKKEKGSWWKNCAHCHCKPRQMHYW